MCRENQAKMIEFVLEPTLPTIALHEDRKKLFEEYVMKRAPPTVEFIDRIDTGTVSGAAYGYQVRPVEMTRGNKQGNNAFVQREHYYTMHKDISQ